MRVSVAVDSLGADDVASASEATDATALKVVDGYLAVQSLYVHSYARFQLPDSGPWTLKVACRGRDREATVRSSATGPKEEWHLTLAPRR